MAAVVQAAAALRRPEIMVFLPAITLAAFWLGGEEMLILTALGLPMVFAMTGALHPRSPDRAATPDGPPMRPQIVGALDAVLRDRNDTGATTACLVLLLDDADRLVDRHGRTAQGEVLQRCADRLCTALRQGDTVARLEGGGFAVALGPVRWLDLEALIQMAGRLQSVIAAPIAVGGAQLYVTCSVGFCLGVRAPEPMGRSLLDAAQVAADDALRNGPGAIRAYSVEMTRARADRAAFRDGLEVALDEGQIRPHFQPQINTDTGAISGFEALARWHHPERGIVAPADFLPAIAESGLSERLGEVILYQALAAMVRWEKAGHRVPTIAVNFSAEELRNPRLAEKLKWELDRFDLTPDRLTVEILETVVAQTDNDVIVQNVAALARLGCGIDLDDFGTGQASITNIRRFAVRRIKIDRSFVTHVDDDRDQQKMVAAILSLAERLGIETLAEGVETPGEHAMLSQLGCGHVQGFGIARPMPYEDTAEWMLRHRNHTANTPRISHRAS